MVTITTARSAQMVFGVFAKGIWLYSHAITQSLGEGTASRASAGAGGAVGIPVKSQPPYALPSAITSSHAMPIVIGPMPFGLSR